MDLTFIPFPFIGEFASLGAAFIWAISLSLFTRYGHGISPGTLNFYKNSLALVAFGICIWLINPDIPSEPGALGVLAVSGIIGLAIGDTALFAALNRLGAQVTAVSQCLSPPLAALLAVLFLGEALSQGEMLGMLVTITAIALVLNVSRKDHGRWENVTARILWEGIMFAILAALCQAAAVVIIRFGMQDVHILVGTSCRILPAIIFLAFTQLSRSNTRLEFGQLFTSKRRLLILSLAAFFGTFVGLLLMSTGAKYAKAGVTSALTATYPIWIIPLAIFWLKEKVSWQIGVYTVLAVFGIGLKMLT